MINKCFSSIFESMIPVLYSMYLHGDKFGDVGHGPIFGQEARFGEVRSGALIILLRI
jgi:hypothetical protein